MERQNRILTVLSIIFLALAAFVMLSKDDGKGKPPEDGSPPRHDLFDYKSEDITTLEVTHGGTTLSFAKTNGAWAMVAPRPLDIDVQRVSEMVDRLGSLEVEERTITGKDEDFGLDEAGRYLVKLGAADGRTFSVELGKDTTVGYATYLREKAGGPVTLASSKVGDLVHRSADDFRSKQVWDLSGATARRIRIEAGGATVVLRKDDHGWWLGDSGPRADQETVEKWLDDANAVRVATFLDDKTPATAGVEPAAARISVEDDTGTKELTLGPTADDGVNAVARNGVVRLGADAAALVKLSDWTSKKLVVIRRYQVDRLEVQLGAKSVDFTRKDGQWLDAAGKPTAIGDVLLDKLAESAADWSGMSVPGVTAPYGRIVVSEGTSRKESLVIGQELGEGVRVAKDDAGGPGFTVKQADLDALLAVMP